MRLANTLNNFQKIKYLFYLKALCQAYRLTIHQAYIVESQYD